MQLTSVGISKSMVESLSGATAAMQSANGEMNIKDIQTMMKNFEKEKMKAEMNSEVMADAMDMGENEEEADDVYNQILGEIGMNMNDPNAVATNAIPGKAVVVPEENKVDEADDLDARLAALS